MQMGFERMKTSLGRSLSGSTRGAGAATPTTTSAGAADSGSSSNERRRAKFRSRASMSAVAAAKAAPPTPSGTSSTSEIHDSPSNTLLKPLPPSPPPTTPVRNATSPAMLRKIWVKRPGASATRVEVREDDLVDNVRDAILHKYANSLGRNIDSPDITLKIISREQANKAVPAERVLGPEEPIGQTLAAYYPDGQTIDEALIIEVPQRRTPRPSPRPGNHQVSYFIPDHYRPDDAARDYFPPMPLQSPHLAHVQHGPSVPGVHSMAVLTTGQLPALPSPGGHSSRRHARPKYGRQHTSSPTILHTQQPGGGLMDTKPQINGGPAATSLPTPPAQAVNEHKQSITPPNRSASPHTSQRAKKKKASSARSANGDPPPPKPASAALLDGTVPPINVLIVEDNVINLKLLEAFMKKLKVRWRSAMNGKEAVAMWRTGGFHLVLMDIQLPVMNGLDATREIRRLEAVNGIGVFSGSPIVSSQKTPCNGEQVGEQDVLPDRSLFKSPVIIVALTASSLQSDRHEALAAGCNDFLTKPVAFIWMERKVTEWGCMQALIDFDGWRKWKAYAKAKESEDPAKKAAEEKEEKAKAKEALKAMFARPPPSSSSSSNTNASTNAKKEEKPTVTTTTTPTIQTNGGPKKPNAPMRTHKSTRSGSASVGGSLGIVGEVDEQ